MGVPKDLVIKLLMVQPTPNFVETGTFKGDTTFWAAKHFHKVITIELNSELSRQVSQRLDCPRNIEFLIGDSSELMSRVVDQLEGSAVFWLDGHYSGPGTAGVSNECPILAELKALRSAINPIILIDDARCFLGPPPPPHNPEHWVSIDRLFAYIFSLFPEHTTTIHDDVIISVPNKLKQILDADWMDHFNERFSQAIPTKRSLFGSMARFWQ